MLNYIIVCNIFEIFISLRHIQIISCTEHTYEIKETSNACIFIPSEYP